MDASLPLGASVKLASNEDDNGGGSGSGEAPVIGKFTGILNSGEGSSFSYLADPGQVVAINDGNESDPQLYPTGARTFETLRVTAINGNASLNPYTVELYKNGVATLQAVTVPAGAAAGAVFSDAAHPISFAANEKFDLLANVAIGDIQRLISAVLEGPAGGGGGGGGGGFPGYGGAPPAVAAASAAGASALASRSDHTHQGVHTVTAGTGLTNSGTATDPILNATGGGGGAAWTVGFATRRYFAIDPVGGNDANAGFSDVSSALAFAAAKKTETGMSAIFPKVGNGRSFELLIGTGTLSAGGLDVIFGGAVGYAADSLVRGTGTNATAGAVAGAGDANDYAYAGFVTTTGMNATGYNPDADTGTVLTLTKVGGGAPAFAAEPAVPIGYRWRWSATTTTVALRNVSYAVVRQTAGTITLNASVTRVASDVGFLEQPGVNVPGYTFGTINQGITLIGIRSTGVVNLTGQGASILLGAGSAGFHFIGCASVGRMLPVSCGLATDDTYVHPTLGNIKVGCAYRCEDLCEIGTCASHLSLYTACASLIVTDSLGHEDFGAQIFGRYFMRGTLTNTTQNHEHAVIGNGGANLGVGPRTRLALADVADKVSLELDGVGATIDGLSIENALGGSVQVRGTSVVVIGPLGLNGTATALAGIDVSQARQSKITIADTATVTCTGTKADLQLAAGAVGSSQQSAFAPLTTLDNLVFGMLKDCSGNTLVGGFGGVANNHAELIGPVVGRKNTTGGAVAQWSVVTDNGTSDIFLCKADSQGDASGLVMVMLTPALAANDYVLCAMQVMSAPLIFDAPPTVNAIVYMSTANAGHVQAAIPTVSGTNQKYRLGLACRNSSGVSVNAAYFNPELFPTLADGQK